MEKDKKVTALYCRLSKDDGSNSESLSIRTQKSMLMEYATRNGFGNCQYYVDDGYSGTNSDRPAFQELLDDMLCAWSICLWRRPAARTDQLWSIRCAAL